ncbi:MAG: protease modulator HflK [Novosphingobium sp.]
MNGSDRNERERPLAMAKGEGPWGGPGKDGEVATEVAPTDADPAPPAAEAPRNPWLIPDTEPAPRRSASIDDIFRGRGGGSGKGGPSLNFRWLPWLIGGSVAAWILATSVHVLAQDERALVTTMGQYTATVGPGLHFTLPWPLQTVLRQQTGTEVRTPIPEKESEALMPTADGELISVPFQVRWRITDLKQYTFNLPDGEAAIRRLADAEVRAGVAEMPFDDLWGARRQAELQQRTMARIQRVLDAWHSGVSISAVEVVRWDPPAQLSDTFKLISEAKQKADKNHVEAERYSAQLMQIAKARAQDFDDAYRTYKIAPDVTKRTMYDDMMAKVLNNNTVVLGGSGVPANLPAAEAKAAPPPPAQGGQ